MFSWSLIAREAYWIIENTDWYISNGLDILTNLFLNQASIEIVIYKQQVLILVVCCVGLAFLCSIAFIPNFLKMRRNLNLNIYLLEKIQTETIQQMYTHIQVFYKQLTSSRGVYGSKGNRNHHRIPEMHYVSTDKVSQEIGMPKKKKMILKSEKNKFK